ncbi:hypothetical protein [Burkholderia pseudomultivorans]|uniref:hypothetical protein n=1 Tax=Burkholderia pseudomultivorans TaxID=1207504 RepID=UPI0012D8DE77|nr:hypothetical protein [Burkholderia pseudomultivorans]
MSGASLGPAEMRVSAARYVLFDESRSGFRFRACDRLKHRSVEGGFVKSVVERRRMGTRAVASRRAGIVPRFAGLLLAGAVSACAVQEGAEAAGAGVGARQVTVACVSAARRGETPCAENAARACGGPAALRKITLVAAIPMTECVDQHPAPMYQYSAVYSCGAAAG